MKKEWVEKNHCPYCKRHCSLQNPHCGKGKTLAEEIKKESKKKEDKKNEDKRNENKREAVKGSENKSKADKSKKNISKEDKSKKDISREDISKENISKENISKIDISEEVKIKEDISKEEIKKENITIEKPLEPVLAFTDSEKEKLSQFSSDLNLFLLYLKGSQSLLNNMGGKSSEKRIRHYILNLLAERVEVTPKELKDITNLDPTVLKKALKRLEKKEEILIQQTEISGRIITLTEKGKREVREQIEEGTKASESLFSILNIEEKKSLKNILLKLMD